MIFIFAGLGLILGSFINALVWRTKEKESIVHGRSMCPHCRHELSSLDLIPVASWLLLGGRCRYCRKPISFQYPLVELATAGVFALSFAAWPRVLGSSFEYVYFGLWLIALVLLVAMAVYDTKWLTLPDKFNWPFLLSAVLSVAVLVQIDVNLLNQHLLGAGLAWAFFALIYYGSKGQWLGGGDVKLSLGVGLWLGWPIVLTGVMLAFYGASLVIIPLLLFKFIKRKQPVAFGPFLIAGAISGMLYGPDLINWYQQTFLLIGV